MSECITCASLIELLDRLISKSVTEQMSAYDDKTDYKAQGRQEAYALIKELVELKSKE